MDLREYAHTEASAFIDRILTAAEASADQVRRSADEQIQALRIAADGLRDESATLRHEADSLREHNHTLGQEIAALTGQAAALRGQLQDLEAQVQSVRAEAEESRVLRDTEAARVATLTGELTSVSQALEAETARAAAALQEQAEAHSEAHARQESLIRDLRAQLAEAEEARVLRDSEADRVATLTSELASMSQALEAETARAAAALQEEAEAHSEAHERLESLIRDLRAQLAEADEVRVLRDAEAGRVATLSTELASMSQALEAETARAAAALQEEAEAHSEAQDRQESLIRDLRARLAAAEEARDGAVEHARSRDTRQSADAETAALRRQLEEANALCDALQEGMAAMRGRRQRVAALTRTSIKAIDALGTAPAVADVLRTVLTQLALEFPRVAIFRVNGKRLEGELAAGFDNTIEITKLVIPTSVPSLVTRAASGSVLEEATSEEIAESRVPLGGSPASALAAPLVFEGETIAVVYADSDAAANDAHAAFAGLLIAHANVLLSRLTQEMKAAKELRQYAKLLLHEAEEMYLADIEEGRTEPDRLRRLHDTIDFGRQLYTQRAALEGASFTGLFDDEITALIGAEPTTAFGSGLAAALPETAARRTAS